MFIYDHTFWLTFIVFGNDFKFLKISVSHFLILFGNYNQIFTHFYFHFKFCNYNYFSLNLFYFWWIFIILLARAIHIQWWYTLICQNLENLPLQKVLWYGFPIGLYLLHQRRYTSVIVCTKRFPNLSYGGRNSIAIVSSHAVPLHTENHTQAHKSMLLF